MRRKTDNQHPVRVGAVSYLNTKPLVFGLADQAARLELVLDVPSRLADALRDGRLDVALIPSVEWLRWPQYRRVSDACIACRGPVLSVKLLSRVPLDRIQSLALDEGSRTSAALVRILLHHCYDVRPATVPLPIGAPAERASADAVLLIGDRAIHTGDTDFVCAWDLGEQWCRWSGLPFVFAVWAARAGIDTTAIGQLLSAARDRGVSCVESIARQEAAAVGLSQAACLTYLRDNLHFFLGHEEQAGLDLFFDQCTALGLFGPRVDWRTTERTSP